MTSRRRSMADLDDGLSCALCQRPIEKRQDYMFRVDGRLEHMKCSAWAREPTARQAPMPTLDLMSQAAQADRTDENSRKELRQITNASAPGPYRLAVRELIEHVEGDPHRLRLMLDEWRASLSAVVFGVHEDTEFFNMLKECVLATVSETISRLADEELQHYRRQT